jgi:hypothetical protein
MGGFQVSVRPNVAIESIDLANMRRKNGNEGLHGWSPLGVAETACTTHGTALQTERAGRRVREPMAANFIAFYSLTRESGKRSHHARRPSFGSRGERTSPSLSVAVVRESNMKAE